MSSIPGRQTERLRFVLAAVWRNADLRRTQLALTAFYSAEWGVWIAMLVYAYQQGGATAAGLAAVAQLIPATLLASSASVLADRHDPARVLLWGYVAQAGAMAATAGVLLAHGPFGVAVACGAAAATAVTVTRPTMAALLPSLARLPEELTAANVVTGFNEAVSLMAAPALTGVLIGLAGPGAVFAVMGALVLAGASVVAPVRGPPAAPEDRPDAGVLAGFRALAHEPAARRLVGMLSAEYIALGMLDVLYVVLALAVLGMGESGAGYLNAAFGLGGALGIVVTASLVGRARLMPSVLVGLATWAAALALLAAWPSVGGALALLAAAGASRAVVDVASRTLLQRTSPPDALARVFGVLESLQAAALAIGSLLAPLIVAVLGGRAAVLAAGLVLPALALVGGRRLLALDAAAHVPVVEIALLRSLRLFARLPAPALETIAQRLEPVSAAAGEDVVTQGDVGDRYYAIAEGSLQALEDGVPGRVMDRGDGFGEIALLRAIPRTATVRALTPAQLYSLGKEPFLEAVTGHPSTARTAATVASERAGRTVA